MTSLVKNLFFKIKYVILYIFYYYLFKMFKSVSLNSVFFYIFNIIFYLMAFIPLLSNL